MTSFSGEYLELRVLKTFSACTDTISFLSCASITRWDVVAFFFSQWNQLARFQDIVALVVQSIGGGIASDTQPGLGGHIALGGIVLQFGSVECHHINRNQHR